MYRCISANLNLLCAYIIVHCAVHMYNVHEQSTCKIPCNGHSKLHKINNAHNVLVKYMYRIEVHVYSCTAERHR